MTKTFLLLIAASTVAYCQPVLSGNPQVRKPNGQLYFVGTSVAWTGGGPPGSISGSQQGDTYLDLTNSLVYQCFSASVNASCNAVAANNWVQVSSAGGTFTNLTVQTLTVTSPLFNSVALTGGETIGGDLGITGGVTVGGTSGITSLTNSNRMGALQLDANSSAALHLTNGGILIDGTGAFNAPSGSVSVNTVSTVFLNVSNTTNFGANLTVTGSISASGSLTGAGITSLGGIVASGNIVSSAGDVRAGGNKAKLVSDGSIVWANGVSSLDISGNVNGVAGGFSGTVTGAGFASTTGNFQVSSDNILFNRASGGIVQQVQWRVGNSVNPAGAWTIGSASDASFTIAGGTGSSTQQRLFIDTGGGFHVNVAGFELQNTGTMIAANGLFVAPGTGGLTMSRATNATVEQIQLNVLANANAVGSWAIGSSGVTAGNLAFVAGTGGSSNEIAHMDNSGNFTVSGALTSTLGITTSGSIVSTGPRIQALQFRNVSMPTSCSGLSVGTFINNSGVVNVCP